MVKVTYTYLVFIKFEYKFKNLSKLFNKGLLHFKMLGGCHGSRAQLEQNFGDHNLCKQMYSTHL